MESSPAKPKRRPRSAPAKRYPTDLSDAQWALIEPLLPPPAPVGRAEKHPRREIVNAILYLDRAGCAWRLLPKCFPPWGTVYWHWAKWKKDGTVDQVHDQLRDQLRDAAGRDPMASAGIIDSQSLRGADTVGAGQRGYDAGKRVNGTKRHIVVDTLGLLLVVMVTAASVQDRDGGRRLLDRLRFAMPSVALVWADGSYAGQLVGWARRVLRVTLEIVRKPADQHGFAVLPRRWVVERTLSWLMRCRRLVRDYERLPDSHETMVKWAMVGLMTRRLAPEPRRRPWAPPAAA
ncbi:IS5 family transposase [Actinophytocola sp.]|uniref:IS5 family transposase n=1 Tax=Actinophytocola sp. TaxID=1872138 RepID=UPI002ED45558